MTTSWSGLVRGALAGAAGTTALNAATELDMTVRGRPASDAPQQVVARLAERGGVPVPGGRRARARRLAGAGSLAGSLTGVGVGAVAGLLRSAGVRVPAALGGPLLGAAAMLASDGPLALLGISDPRRWSAADWVADAVPHLVYGLTTHAALVAALPVEPDSAELPVVSPPDPSPARALLRAAALGAATGARSSAGIAAVALTSTRSDPGPVASTVGGGPATAVVAVLAGGEVLVDKTPVVPSRTAVQGLLPRAVLGATSAVGVARRDGHDPAPAAVVGLAAAVGAALLGVRARAALARRVGSDLPGAVAEDVLAAVLGWLGARRP